jgi:hypothetical protein
VDTRFNGQVTGGRFALAFAIEGNRVARLVSATTLVGGVEPLMRRIERLARGAIGARRAGSAGTTVRQIIGPGLIEMFFANPISVLATTADWRHQLCLDKGRHKSDDASEP